jgi:trk system potassium uptake protein TrkA
LKFARRGNVISLATIEGSNSEVLEIEIKTGSQILDTPLKDLHFPHGAIIGAIVHQQGYEIPDGENRLKIGDRVLVFALPEALAKVERFFE